MFIPSLVLECLLSVIRNNSKVLTFTNGRGKNCFLYSLCVLFVTDIYEREWLYLNTYDTCMHCIWRWTRARKCATYVQIVRDRRLIKIFTNYGCKNDINNSRSSLKLYCSHILLVFHTIIFAYEISDSARFLPINLQ